MKEKDLLEFIHFFTHNKNLTRSQRLKRNKLLARDYAEGAESLHEESPQRLDFESAHDEVDGPTKSIPYYRTGVNGVNYVSPQHIQSFLRDYNQDDVLKYTCHLIDTDEIIKDICSECGSEKYDFQKHKKLICNRFYSLRKRYKDEERFLNPNMITLINTYLTGKDMKGNTTSWSSNAIQVNWSSEQLEDWSNNNPYIIPNPGKNIAK